MISNQDREKYLQILAVLNENHAKLFTLRELSLRLRVSERKLIDFKRGKIVDFWLLTQYAGIIGRGVKFYLS